MSYLSAARHAAAAAIIALVSATWMYAAFPPVRNFEKSEYQAGTQNWCITQNSGKFIYVANNEGLLEFDGMKWTTIPIANYTNVRSVLYDNATGRIYAGAFNEFGYYSLDNAGNMKYTSLMGAFSKIEGISEIWKIIRTGERFYLQGDDRVLVYTPGEEAKEYRTGKKVNCISAIGDRVYISVMGEGIMTEGSNGLAQIPGCAALKDKKVCAIIPYRGNKILFVTEFDGLFIYDGESVKGLTADFSENLKKAQVFCAGSDGRTLALGTVSDGVYIIDMETFSDTHLNIFSGLQNNSVLSLFFDIDGNLWLGLDKGIDYVTLNSPEEEIFSNGKLYGTGYASIVKYGRLYLGTNQGLYFMDIRDALESEGQTGQVKGIKGQVWCLEEIDNTLFCGHDHGLYTISRDNTASRIEGLPGIWKIKECPFSPGDILGCSYAGLFILRKENGQWTPHPIKGFNESSGTFEASPDGTIWMHHWMKGLFRLTVNEKRDSIETIEYFSKEQGFPTDRNNMTNSFNGRIIFSSEGGYWEYDDSIGRMIPFAALNRLFASPPVAAKIEESPAGDLLFLSGTMQALARLENGQYAIDSLSLKFLQDKRIPGFDNIRWIDRDRFIINTENGFSLIDTRKLNNNVQRKSENVMIKNIHITAGIDSLVFGTRTPIHAGNDTVMLRLPYKNNSLLFEFASPQFSRENAVMYSWWLENYDSGWSSWSGTSSKEYTGLPYGSYVFHVKARTRDSLSPDMPECSFRFTIMPPWYLSKTAIAIYAVMLAFCVYGMISLVGSYSDRQTAEMKKRKEAEMYEQKIRFEEESKRQEREIVMLRNQTLESDLKHKSQDLATSTMNLIRKNEILIRIKNEIGKVQAEMGDPSNAAKNQKRLQKIQADIRENIGHDDDWQKFEHNFDSVYENYLKRLKRDFPRLTVSDMKLCAYLKMDLSSKDMASMMNMSVRSVEQARYRLRQKLGLDRETNLSEFLQDF